MYACKTDFREQFYFLEINQPSSESCLLIHNNLMVHMVFTSDKSFMFPPYQLWMVGCWPAMDFAGGGGSELDHGEGT